MTTIRNVLLVGHCGFDAPLLRDAVERIAGDAVTIKQADRAEQVRDSGSDTLLLINRQLGWGFGVDSGVELIRELAAQPNPPAMMLVSNYADAQRDAVSAGALPGFGKAALNNPETLRRLHDALHNEPTNAPAQER